MIPKFALSVRQPWACPAMVVAAIRTPQDSKCPSDGKVILPPSQIRNKTMAESQQVMFATVPEEQKFSFRITPLPGRLMDTETVGGTLTQIGKLYKAIGNDIDLKVKWKTCVVDIAIEEDGSLRFDMVVCPVDDVDEPTPRASPA